MSRWPVVAALFALLALPAAADSIPGGMVVTPLHFFAPGRTGDPVDTLYLKAGTELQYVNLDRDVHSVTSVLKQGRRPLFDSGIFHTGQTGPVTGTDVLDPGRYEFFCEAHPTEMSGALIVI